MASNEVTETQLLKFKLNDAFSHLLKTETAQRGFILTGDSSFLRDFDLAQQPIKSLLHELHALVTDDKQQNAKLKAATIVFDSRIKHIANTLAIHKKISKEQLEAMLVTGNLITDELDRRIDEMITTEDQLLAKRIALQQKEERNTSIFVLLFSIISICMLTFGFYKVKTEFFNNRLLQQKVQERTDEVNKANKMLSTQNIELRRKNDELSSFTFVANHDLKEPLRKIEFFTTRISDSGDPMSAENKKLLVKTIACVKRMKELLEAIFVYTFTDKLTKFVPVDLNRIVEASIKNNEEKINSLDAKITYHHLPEIQAVPQHMEQLFTNLLSNSLKYSKKDRKPVITIDAEHKNGGPQGGLWKIIFRDNGIGFDEAYREKIFGMFQRLHSRQEYSGTGIGLTICKKIVDLHQGKISAHAIPGEGAEFTILLPDNKSRNLEAYN